MPWEVARLWACDALKGAAANTGFGPNRPRIEQIVSGKVTRNAAPLRSGRDLLSLFIFDHTTSLRDNSAKALGYSVEPFHGYELTPTFAFQSAPKQSSGTSLTTVHQSRRLQGIVSPLK